MDDEKQPARRVGDKEFTAVWSLERQARYGYFIKRAAAAGAVWSLRDENGWCLEHDSEGTRGYFPVWPYERFAKACANGPWKDARPEAIDIDDWVEAWLPKLAEDGIDVTVFPTNADDGVMLSPDRLQRDLDRELSKFEAADRPSR